MFAIDDFPRCCPHCQTEITASVHAEDFYGGATIACRECKATYRYWSKEDTKRAEPPAPAKKKTFCVTCTQALPPGQKHPEFFGQSDLVPDSTNVYDVSEQLQFILMHIHTVSDTLMEILDPKPDRLLFGLYQLLSQLADEAERRAIRLRNVGMYWQGELDDRNDGSLFPDLPPPRKHVLHGQNGVR